MIHDGIIKGPFIETTNNILKGLSQFPDFQNFYSYKRCKGMKPDSSQPACIYGTARTHKFKSSKEIIVANLKFRPIIDQTGTFTYNVRKILTQNIPNMLSSIPPLQDDKEDVSYDVESMFTDILIEETINYIIDVQNKLAAIFLKMIFIKLLVKLATESTFKFNNRLLKQVDGCTMGEPLWVNH